MRISIRPDGWAARTILCFAATAGIVYVNMMAVLVDALHAGLGFTVQEAGRVGSLNTYGGAFGALSMTFFARRLPWRPTLLVLAGALLALDALSMAIITPLAMMALRFVHGLAGGAMVGMAFLLISRVDHPARTFGLLMVLQYGIAMVTVGIVPALVRTQGVGIVFELLMGFSVTTFLLVILLPEYPPRVVASGTAEEAGAHGAARRVQLRAMVSVLLFQAGNMGLCAYSIDLGQYLGLPLDFVTWSLSLSGLSGLIAGVLVAVMPVHWGLTRPTLAGVALCGLSAAAINWADSHSVWLVANLVASFAWAAVLPMLFAMSARADPLGRGAVWASFMSKFGLASGPMIGSFILDTPWRYLALIGVSTLLIVSVIGWAIEPLRVADKRLAAPG